MDFTHRQVRDGIWHIADGRNNYCTLVVGEKRAILFDTTMGFDDLRGYISQFTELEPMVINSHCHFDHAGGNHQFERVWMSERDLPLMDVTMEEIPTLEQHFQVDLSLMKESFSRRERVAFIEPGETIDLGGRTVEVIDMAGHTPGCIGLLCVEDRLLLGGDGVSPQMCIFFRESLPLEAYVQTLNRLWDVPFDSFLLSHFDKEFPKETLRKFEACVELVGKRRGLNYTFAPLPELKGIFYILTPRDADIGELVGLAVKRPEDEEKER